MSRVAARLTIIWTLDLTSSSNKNTRTRAHTVFVTAVASSERTKARSNMRNLESQSARELIVNECSDRQLSERTNERPRECGNEGSRKQTSG